MISKHPLRHPPHSVDLSLIEQLVQSYSFSAAKTVDNGDSCVFYDHRQHETVADLERLRVQQIRSSLPRPREPATPSQHGFSMPDEKRILISVENGSITVPDEELVAVDQEVTWHTQGDMDEWSVKFTPCTPFRRLRFWDKSEFGGTGNEEDGGKAKKDGIFLYEVIVKTREKTLRLPDRDRLPPRIVIRDML
jgi:hypothetical protein